MLTKHTSNKSNDTQEWEFIKHEELKHIDGHTLLLVSGSWQYPLEVTPVIVTEMPAVETSRLIRSGMNFARKNSLSKASQLRQQQQTSKQTKTARITKNNRPVLSLKRTEEIS